MTQQAKQAGAAYVGPGGEFKRIASATVLEGDEILCVFSNGEKRVFKFKSLLKGAPASEFVKETLEPLNFQKIFVARGSLEWPNGFTVHADIVYQASSPHT